MSRIASCRHAIGTWRRENVLNSEHRLSEIKDKVDILHASDVATTEEIREATKELHEALRAEETFWRKKSRVIWLREGNRNSNFFHATTIHRRAWNRISRLVDQTGRIEKSEDGIVAIATEYFRNLFHTSNPSGIAEAITHVKTSIIKTMNAELTKSISESEVKRVLFAMHPEKAHGPD